MATNKDFSEIIRHILQDVRVELDDAFDRNFERQAFFSEKWARAKHPSKAGRHVLVDSGALRRSIRGKVSAGKITWESTLPYAAIHNEGGEIVVTAKMKRFFWAKYYEANKGMGRRKNGEMRANKQNVQLGATAEFWKHMALMKVGSTITIPKRQFIGASPEVERIVESIIDECLDEFFKQYEL